MPARIIIACAIAFCSIRAIFVPATVSAEESILQDEWQNVIFDGKKIGFTRYKVAKESSGYRIETKALVRMDVLDAIQEISFSQTAWLGPDLKPLRFTSLQKIMDASQMVSGVVTGKNILLRRVVAAEASTESLTWPEDALFSSALWFTISRAGLVAGKKFEYRMFMESIGTFVPVEIEVVSVRKQGATPADTEYVIRQKIRSAAVESVITGDGRPIEETSPQGMRTVSVTEKEALSFPAENVPITSFLTFSLIKPDKRIPNPGAVKNMTVTITGLARTNLIPEDGRQEILRAAKSASATASTPAYDVEVEIRAGPEFAEKVTSAESAEYLNATSEIQSGHPRIRAKSAEITGKATDPAEKAKLINRWVFENVKKKFVDTFSAVDALDKLEGECEAHSNLFTALARAAGIPTRIASGLVYTPQFDGFLYHSWAESAINGVWAPIDPTFGQDRADATHIKLVTGGFEQKIGLIELVGRIGLRVNSFN